MGIEPFCLAVRRRSPGRVAPLGGGPPSPLIPARKIRVSAAISCIEERDATAGDNTRCASTLFFQALHNWELRTTLRTGNTRGDWSSRSRPTAFQEGLTVDYIRVAVRDLMVARRRVTSMQRRRHGRRGFPTMNREIPLSEFGGFPGKLHLPFDFRPGAAHRYPARSENRASVAWGPSDGVLGLTG